MKKNNRGWIKYAATAVAVVLLVLIIYVDVQSSSVVPVLMYHSIGPMPASETQYSGLSVSAEMFDYQMGLLAKHRYNVVGPDKVIAYMTGKEKMPPRTVAVTADDGFMNFYDAAYPILKKYNLPATVFVITEKIGQKDYLGWSQLREISDSGLVTIGSHTKSHPWLPTVSVDEDKLRDELAGSKETLERGLGKGVHYLCYPSGAFNGLVQEAARKYGYKGAFTTNPSRKSDIKDIYAIRRLKMSSSSDNYILTSGRLSRYYVWYKERR